MMSRFGSWITKKTLKLAMATGATVTATEVTFDWKDAVIDASIVAALTFFTTVGAGSATGWLEFSKAVIVGAFASATQFFMWIAIKRGLREK